MVEVLSTQIVVGCWLGVLHCVDSEYVQHLDDEKRHIAVKCEVLACKVRKDHLVIATSLIVTCDLLHT
jgi:hypothetical protein